MATSRFRKLTRVLVANRGEIALRIIRSLKDLGIESVAVYSDADKSSRHRYYADYAVSLPGVASSDTYLNIPKLVQAIRASGADGVHPGYGFLSENPAFVEAVTTAGAVFIGPPAEAMKKMGNKIQARNLMAKHGVPVVPGATEPLKDAAELKKLAKEIGYPLILKAAGGGGGRGMRVVRTEDELAPSLEACTREAQAYFGSSDVFCERYIENPRHIEFQVLFDAHGNGVHLFERDCSVQRRHQKLFEEAPSQYLNAEQRKSIGDKAVAAARAAGYVGAGTIEFISETPEKTFFMEMNTRIQVEHPVTEMITGKDLIALQVRVAEGEKLPFRQDDLRIHGWAMEARINAEDPARDFAPGPGLVTALELPHGPGIRVDTHLYPGYRIPDAYDSLVAKIIAWGETRAEATFRMRRALAELRIKGVPTTARFHEALLAHPDFLKGNLTTRFIENNAAYWDETLKGKSKTALAETGGLAALAAVLTQDQGALPPAPVKGESRWRKAAAEEGIT